ncbi:GerMN domain-containing protein [Spirochaetes bacterium]|uniref:GerMN domain-containing protein n=1 Tax=Candidatus Scatousia excrementipullorum TaxID=2840936 RepID=A0A9D9DMQ6_9BACT|nr:GerMN domain-containing protein [Candidatus Scatousia excrementipullorum]
MQTDQKVFLGLVGVAMIAASVYLGLQMLTPGNMEIEDPSTPPPVTTPVENPQQPSVPVQPKEKEYANIVFIGQNDNHEEIYKIVKREYSPQIDGSKFKFAISSLILGPTKSEKNAGIYSEIPTGTEILDIDERSSVVIINLSRQFEFGGGTDSVYKRLYQLIKTARRNTEKPVYLYIEGKQADVIGGDGIMISQPLTENSLDE